MILILGAFAATRGEDRSPRPKHPLQRLPATNDPVERACALPPKHLARIWRGHHPTRSEDIKLVPREPNFIGRHSILSHSGPWEYLQRVPLILYGPGFIADAGDVDRPVTVADVYPTVGELVGVDLEERDGRVLAESLEPERSGRPRLIVTIVWDGGGSNVLEAWPRRWPTLERIARAGTSYTRATVGSSPSITSAVHTTLGTGAFPRSHGITGGDIRKTDGSLHATFAGHDPKDVRLTTFADQIDAAFQNRSDVGLTGWRNWHLGMLSHGAGIRGADRDQIGIFTMGQGEVVTRGRRGPYEIPDYLSRAADIDSLIDEVDREDGAVDDRWYRMHLREEEWAPPWVLGNPAWVRYQQRATVDLLGTEGYGDDGVPDLFFTNVKQIDIVAHRWAIQSQEVAGIIDAHDEALADLLEYLDREVGDYVVIMTADHGHTPSVESSGAWAIGQQEVIDDIDDHFAVPDQQTLIEDSSPVGYFVDRAVADEMGVTNQEISRFLNAYTIADNVSGDLPEAFEDRSREKVFAAVFPGSAMGDVMRCAFDSEQPPSSLPG
jgi:predicted AlkP superfamily pyrophosphatase or phosphodiesterase